jgi:hypothetical protein
MLLVLLIPGVATAQDVATFERVLIPTIITEAPGGYGSLWSTELYVFNGANQPANIAYSYSCPYECSAAILFDPGDPRELPRLLAPPLEQPGMLLYVERPYNEHFSYSLRAKDLSRQALTWGTEIPIIRENEVMTGRVELLNIPLDARFRQNIRFYDIDARESSTVHVRYFAMEGGALLAEQDITLLGQSRAGDIPLFPGYAVVHNVASVLGLQGADRVRAEITPVTQGLRFWAFASITNNETQHVTIITPQ